MTEIAYDVLEKYPKMPPNKHWGELKNQVIVINYCCHNFMTPRLAASASTRLAVIHQRKLALQAAMALGETRRVLQNAINSKTGMRWLEITTPQTIIPICIVITVIIVRASRYIIARYPSLLLIEMLWLWRKDFACEPHLWDGCWSVTISSAVYAEHRGSADVGRVVSQSREGWPYHRCLVWDGKGAH